MHKVMYIRVGKKGSLGPWSRVIEYGSKLSFCQNDSPIALGDHFGKRTACYNTQLKLLKVTTQTYTPILNTKSKYSEVHE